ncbi:double-stranded RNA-binding protein Staufen homolog isoform X2 [Liolophura sinensis]|uniref:double-stranded RNA-binding protein Staufen homolog isoform X2 n=1 Tax=Liolophura sinensis TaxID=3198878 RepID=UPI00315887CC
MMSQVSKNSAGASSETTEAGPGLLYSRSVVTPPGKSGMEKSEVTGTATTMTSVTSSSMSPVPGVLNLHPNLLSSFQQAKMTAPALPANKLKVTGNAGTNQNGAVSKTLGNSGLEAGGFINGGGSLAGVSVAGGSATEGAVTAKAKSSPSEMSALQQQFEHLQMINDSLANTKEKTPMCLINELARFNKVQHQYTLIDEQGPAHKKTFYVKLKLGEEEYSAQGPSIKKAQHAAASSALAATALEHPPPKPPRATLVGGNGVNNITPTVELNALAMKRGEAAVYKPIEPRHPSYYPPPNFDFRGMYNQRYHYPRMPRMFYTSLKVGPREFIGEGPTRQAARHMAATKALKILRLIPLPNQSAGKIKDEPDITKTEILDEKDNLKSEISLVHEIALKRNLEVVFQVTRESGPPHMKVFVTQCRVGDYTTEAQGNSKKLSKKKAAEKMLEQLRQLPSVTSTSQKAKPKMMTTKKKNRNLIKAQKADPGYGVGINPISRLIQIMQAQKKKEPVYTLITERGQPRRREFVMQVCVEDKTCTGVGPNKKLAKRNAAEEMLQLLGFSRPSPQPSKPALKSGISDFASGDKKVTFSDPEDGIATNGKGVRQLMPGLLFLPEKSRQPNVGRRNLGSLAGGDNLQVTNFLNMNTGLRAEQQLVAIAKANNFTVEFDDFSGKECLCRVTMSTTPTHSVHGTGPTRQAARDTASFAALKHLVESGTVDLKAIAAGEDKVVSGDGPVKSTNDVGITMKGGLVGDSLRTTATL